MGYLYRNQHSGKHTFDKVDEVIRDRNLGSYVAELREDGEEQVGLLPKRTNVVVANGILLYAPWKNV